jgi:hypothetical protein
MALSQRDVMCLDDDGDDGDDDAVVCWHDNNAGRLRSR